MALLRSVLILFITQVIFVFAQPSVQLQNALSTIKQSEIFENLKFLASDSLKGRSAGSSENNVAAEFIAKKFIEYGLKPAGNVKTLYQARLKSKKKDELYLPEEYFQKFSFIKSKLSENNSLKICRTSYLSEFEISFPYRKDFVIQVSNLFNDIYIKAPIVFAGYGIDKGENNYNDYVDEKGKQADVKNKIVLIVDGFPQENNPESPFSRSKNALYRNPLRKMEVAQKLGALAVMVVSSPLKNEPPFNVKYESRITAYENPSFHLPVQVSNSIPIVFISENVAYEIFKDANTNIKDLLQRIDRNLKGNAFEFPSTQIELKINFEKEIITTQNVAGIIEGNDEKLKNEFIVIGAHYDHIGLGYYGAMNKTDTGKIHNGADDNASGTSALIELAEAFSIEKPKRSLLFIAFSAEENGLLGSRFFVNYQPLVPLEKIIAMFNFDMVGRNEPELLWIGGAFYSEDLRKIIEKANTEVGFELLYNVGLLNFASDQAPFLKKEIPSAFFFSGLHDDYHTPNDDYDKIDYIKLSNVVKLGFLAIESLANSEFKPAYKELSPAERGILKLTCEVDHIYLEPIFSNIDEADFINPLAGEIFKELKTHYFDLPAGEKIDTLYIMNKLDREELKSIFADALTERYKISDGWEEFQEINLLDNSVEKTLTDYIKNLKDLSLSKKIEELYQKVATTFDLDEANRILQEVDKLVKERKFYQEKFEVKLIH